MPHFEVNTRTVELLYQLAQSSEARCSDTALLIEDLKQKASEYEADGKNHLSINNTEFCWSTRVRRASATVTLCKCLILDIYVVFHSGLSYNTYYRTECRCGYHKSTAAPVLVVCMMLLILGMIDKTVNTVYDPVLSPP